jgi:WD40 repeat protein/energy-coupling factor transporter ATP-binding protein EcfA2
MGGVLSSLRKQLAEAEENLLLIQVRKSEYVQEIDIPLQLVKEERRLDAHIADLQARLTRLIETPCPYRGLEPFEAEHAAFYFGREKMVERLVAKVKESAFVAVVGSSGCGKTSLVRAGLVAALRQGALPSSQEWVIRFFRPGPDPLRAFTTPLVALLEPEATEVTRMEEARRLADDLCQGTLSLADVGAHLCERQPTLPRLVLIADQFEELYTECPDEALRQTFIEMLLSAAEQRITIVLALRADFYGHVLANRLLGQAMDAGLVNVLPMSEAELREAIEKPALQTGRAFESGLVDRILNDVAEQPGNLPLLEFALTELWPHQTAEGVLTHAGYEEIGQVVGAIAQQVEAVYRELEAKGQKEIVRRIFLRLTHYSEGAEGTRRRAMLSELSTRHTPQAAIEQVVRTLADARLLVTGQDEATGTATVEVAHEVLIRGWARLRDWIKDDRAFGLWRERLTTVQRLWEENKHDEGALLRGAPLSEAESWLAGRGDDLNEVECAFVQDSLKLREREHAEREAARQRELEAAQKLAEAEKRRAEEQAQAATRLRRRSRIATGLALAAALLACSACCLGFLVWSGINPLAVILSELAGSSTGHTDTVRSVAFSPDGKTLASGSADTTIRLWDVATGQPIGQPLRGHTHIVISVAFSPDGKTLASGSADHTIRLWDVATGQPIGQPLRDPAVDMDKVAFSPDGKIFASAGSSTAILLKDVASGQLIGQPLRGHTNVVHSAAFSPDGKMLASGSGDKTIILWDVATHEPIGRPLTGHTDSVLSVAFSPDGKTLASGSFDTTIRLWDEATGQLIGQPLTGHTGLVATVAFSPDGKTLASGSFDTTIRLWDVATGQLIGQPLRGHTNVVYSVAFSPDGKMLAAGCGDSTIRLWNVATGQPLDQPFGRPAAFTTICSNALCPLGVLLIVLGVGLVFVHLVRRPRGRA